MATIDEINRALADPSLSPREAIRLREQLINAGVKGTSLHLGAVTPEVLAQLKASEKQNNFTTSKAQIRKNTNLAISKNGLGLGNSSTRPELTQQTAKKVFKIQKDYTQQVGSQVQGAYASPEFQAIKQGGSQGGKVNTNELFANLLNNMGIAVPTYHRAIITELAQQDIQGKQATEQNISRILSNQGFPAVDVKITDQGTLNTGSAGGDLLPQIISSINGGISGGQIGSGELPSPTYGFDETAQDNAGGSGILGFLKNPIVLIVLVGIVLAILFRGKLK